MGFAAYTDWLQAPATTGQVTYTVTGFGYLPKLLILRANGLTTSNGGGFDALMGVGAATSSSNQGAAFTLSAHNQESPFIRRGASGSDCILVRDGSNTVILQASLVSFALDGDDAKFTLDWSVTTENAHIQYDLIGGDDVEASVAFFYGNSSSVDVPHGLSDAPTALMALVMGHSSTNPTFVSSNNAGLAVGVSDLTTSRCVAAIAEASGAGISATQRSWTSGLIHFPNAGGGTLLAGDVASVDATNVTLAFSVTGNRNGFLIAMRGVQAHAGETTIPAAGNLAISGCPFRPAYGMFLSPCGEGSGNDARMMIGAAGSATGSRSMSIGIAEQNNQDTTNARRFIAQDIAVNYRDHAGNIVFAGMVDEFTSDGADIIMSVNPSDGLDYVLGYMFLAEAEADDPEPPTATGLPGRKFTVRPCVRPVMYPCVWPCVGG